MMMTITFFYFLFIYLLIINGSDRTCLCLNYYTGLWMVILGVVFGGVVWGFWGVAFLGLERGGFGWMTKMASFGKGGCERGRVNLGGE